MPTSTPADLAAPTPSTSQRPSAVRGGGHPTAHADNQSTSIHGHLPRRQASRVQPCSNTRAGTNLPRRGRSTSESHAALRMGLQWQQSAIPGCHHTSSGAGLAPDTPTYLGCTERLQTSTRCRTCSLDAVAVTRLRRAHHGHTIICVVADDWSHRSSRTPERRAMLQRGPGLHDVRGLHPPVPSRTPGRGQMDHRAQRCHPRLLLLHPARLVETEVLRGVAEPCVRQWTTCSSLLATRVVRRHQ